MIQGRKYIVATTKEWNIKIFNEKISKFPGSWKLVRQSGQLKFNDIKAFDPCCLFFIHWSEKVPKRITDNFKCICFHMTDLPYGRGGSPLQNLIARGHKETMISAIGMVEEIDAGPVYYKSPLSLLGNAEEILIRASKIIAGMIHLLIEAEPQPKAQQGKVIKFKRRSPSESRIPEDTNLEKIFDWIRMLDTEGYPRAFITNGKLKIEFKRAVLRSEAIEADARITIKHEEE